jgi:outer membrane protein assembly factor BamB
MLCRALALFLLCSSAIHAADWTQFRGPNASGVSDSKDIPTEFSPTKNVVWKTPLPPGHSSPVLISDRIFLTAVDRQKLFTICLDRATGKELWRREAPRPREQKLHTNNNPASPSAVSDGKNVYVFFTDFGLISFTADGKERWRHPLGPFNNPFGMGASPVLAGNTLVMVCDSESGSFVISVDKDTGAKKWRVERPDAARGFSTPLVYQPPDGPLQVLVTGSYRMTAYAVENGETVWWVTGLTWQLKPTPVMDKDFVYVLGWAGGSDTGQQESVPPFEEVLKAWDKNHDGKLSKDEIPDEKILKAWDENDLDNDGFLDERDWRMYRSKRAAQNAINSFRLGGHGDMTEKNKQWQYTKSLPNCTSPLLYQGVLYMVKEGGILTALDPATGKVLKQGRLRGGPGYYYSSPVAADGKLLAISEEGKVSVVKAGADWEVLAVNDMDDNCHATPAIVDGRIYLRTHSALWCFARQ